jgi:hypothetical protein
MEYLYGENVPSQVGSWLLNRDLTLHGRNEKRLASMQTECNKYEGNVFITHH